MARPTTTGINRVTLPSGGFGPRQQGATERAGVYAPLDVRTGPSSAEQLANALGLATETVTPAIKAQVAKKAEDQTRAGMADAMLGVKNDARAAEDAYYARGQKKTFADKDTLVAVADWQKRFETGEVDKASTATVSADFNQFMHGRLGHLLADKETAQWALEKLQPFQAQVLGALQKEQVAKFKEDTIATVGASVRLAAKTKTPVNFEDEKNKLVGAGFTKGEATAVAVSQLGQVAIEMRDPSVLDQVPEKWADGTPGPLSVPSILEQWNKDRYYAESAQRADAAEAKRVATEKATADVTEATIMAANGNVAGTRKIADQMLRDGLIERSEYQSLVGFASGRLDFYRDEVVTADSIAQFRADLSEGKFGSEREALMTARNLMPGGKPGAQWMAQVADDITSTFRSKENDSNPLAKAYRTDLDTRFKPVVANATRNANYAAVMLAFDKKMHETKDPEKAKEAAEVVAKQLEGKPKPGTARKVGNAVVTEVTN